MIIMNTKDEPARLDSSQTCFVPKCGMQVSSLEEFIQWERALRESEMFVS